MLRSFRCFSIICRSEHSAAASCVSAGETSAYPIGCGFRLLGSTDAGGKLYCASSKPDMQWGRACYSGLSDADQFSGRTRPCRYPRFKCEWTSSTLQCASSPGYAGGKAVRERYNALGMPLQSNQCINRAILPRRRICRSGACADFTRKQPKRGTCGIQIALESISSDWRVEAIANSLVLPRAGSCVALRRADCACRDISRMPLHFDIDSDHILLRPAHRLQGMHRQHVSKHIPLCRGMTAASVLITGASGFLGQRLAVAFHKQGHTVAHLQESSARDTCQHCVL